MSFMKFCILMNQNAFAGRQFVQDLIVNGFDFDVIEVGTCSAENETEKIRCGGRWNPPLLNELSGNFSLFHFSDLKDKLLLDHLDNIQYDFAIQGGTGILKEILFSKFRWGILNFHPGKLPEYRGCSAPEWQLLHGNPVVCTCHLIDEGIDTGPVYARKTLMTDMTSYEHFRASIYPLVSSFVVDVVKEIMTWDSLSPYLVAQDERHAEYRPYIGDERIAYIRKSFSILAGRIDSY
jgi:methionyl-tRNA formyltransferase